MRFAVKARTFCCLGLALAGGASPAAAQVTPHASIEATTDERRRGLSWSDGGVAPAASVRLELPGGFDAGARVTSTRGDPRHDGADAVIEPTLGYGVALAGFRLDGFATAHLFTGAGSGMDYAEVGAGASYALGPAEAGVEARYAPSQDAIGGDNLYLAVRGRVGIPLTPWTVTGHVGRSSGSVDDPLRAARLRPAGTYHDWALGVQHITGPLTLGVEYTGTDISDDGPPLSPFAARNHAGDRIAARVAFGF